MADHTSIIEQATSAGIGAASAGIVSVFILWLRKRMRNPTTTALIQIQEHLNRNSIKDRIFAGVLGTMLDTNINFYESLTRDKKLKREEDVEALLKLREIKKALDAFYIDTTSSCIDLGLSEKGGKND